jgi:hypothetical protein
MHTESLISLVGVVYIRKLQKCYEKTGSPSVYVDAMILNPKIKVAKWFQGAGMGEHGC